VVAGIVFIYAPHRLSNALFVALTPTSFQRSHPAELMLRVPRPRSFGIQKSHGVTINARSDVHVFVPASATTGMRIVVL